MCLYRASLASARRDFEFPREATLLEQLSMWRINGSETQSRVFLAWTIAYKSSTGDVALGIQNTSSIQIALTSFAFRPARLRCSLEDLFLFAFHKACPESPGFIPLVDQARQLEGCGGVMRIDSDGPVSLRAVTGRKIGNQCTGCKCLNRNAAGLKISTAFAACSKVRAWLGIPLFSARAPGTEPPAASESPVQTSTPPAYRRHERQ